MTLFRSFRRDVTAATSVLFALMLVPLVTAGGMAVDMSRVMTERSRVQGALDAAIRAAACRRTPLPSTSRSPNRRLRPIWARAR